MTPPRSGRRSARGVLVPVLILGSVVLGSGSALTPAPQPAMTGRNGPSNSHTSAPDTADEPRAVDTDALVAWVTATAPVAPWRPWQPRPSSLASSPVGPSTPTATAAGWPAPLAAYPGSCDRSPGPTGLLEVYRTSADPRGFGWGWRTCPSATTPDAAPTVIFLLAPAGRSEGETATHLVVQYPDGRARAFATHGQVDPTRYELLGSVIGSVRPLGAGFEGHLAFDVDAVELPGVYRFAVLSIDGAGRAERLPPPGHPGELLHPRRCPAVAATAPTGPHRLHGADPSAGQWLGRAVNAPGASAGTRGEGVPAMTETAGVEVAVIDSGIAPVPALAPFLRQGADSVVGQPIAPGADSAHGSHGTAVASLIAAVPTRGTPWGVGLAAGTPIVPLRVTGHDGCVSGRAIADALDAIVEQGRARVVNLSFGGAAEPQLRAALDRAVAAGLIIVAATGNDAHIAPGRASYPATHPAVIGVGATTADGAHAPYSQLVGAEIHAPGGSLACLRGQRCDAASDLVTFDRHGDAQLVAGTSYAAAVVSAAVARWLSVHPDASLEEVRFALQRSGRELVGTRHDSPLVALDLGRLLTQPRGAGG